MLCKGGVLQFKNWENAWRHSFTIHADFQILYTKNDTKLLRKQGNRQMKFGFKF